MRALKITMHALHWLSAGRLAWADGMRIAMALLLCFLCIVTDQHETRSVSQHEGARLFLDKQPARNGHQRLEVDEGPGGYEKALPAWAEWQRRFLPGVKI